MSRTLVTAGAGFIGSNLVHSSTIILYRQYEPWWAPKKDETGAKYLAAGQ